VREFSAWQRAESALAAETVIASLGDARLVWQRLAKFSVRGRNMTFGP